MPIVSGSRRDRGDGTWEELPSGKVRLVIQVDGIRIKSKAKPTKTEAKASLKEKLEDLANPGAASTKSFSIAAHDWLKSRRRLSPTTKEVYGYWVASIEKDALGTVPVDRITSKHLEAWKSRQRLAKTTLRNRCSWINQVLSFAGSEVRIGVPPKGRHARRPLDPDERKALIELLSKLDPDAKMFALLCFVCGLRRSEACGLQHDDRVGDGFIPRRSAVVVGRKIIVRQSLKTDESEAWVPIPPFLDKLIGGKPGYVVGGTRGPLSGKMLYERVKKAARGTALEKVPYFGLHALRRTYGMMQLEAGADVVTVASNMRHSAQMLLEEYARSRTDLKARSVESAFTNTLDGIMDSDAEDSET
jgi:integrase